ncbi:MULTISPECIES: DnaJ domain-containing protein [unclassified Bradyrhizobium]|uniref:DnaJ domain-containing protein n=1 Tax=unclassified Bradyrhizobium TaxID=2631580 RepID=UPI0028E8D0C8|nr:MULTISPECIES: DnaJ domain-containing protein [unclassified Bradyrhizobium]
MKTLYDLLGALPDDDAEDIRAAFRKAVKESHPDINPGDPDAALRFRQIIRANDILGDKEQRTAYDRLLGAARDEHRQESKLVVAARVHKVASGVMALAGASAMALTGYLLFTHMSAASVAPLEPIVVATNKVKPHEVPANPIESASVAPTAGEAAANAGSEPAAGVTTGSAATAAEPLPIRVSKVDAVSSAEQEHASCGQATTAACVSDATLPGGTTSNEARAYRDRGMASFQKGDLNAALADLDAAIQLDPRYYDAYIDRGIVFYRMRKFDRAFADVAAAKRIEKTNRAVLDAMAKRQPLRPLKLDPPKPDMRADAKADIKADAPKADTPRVATAATMSPRMSTATPIYATSDPSRAP